MPVKATENAIVKPLPFDKKIEQGIKRFNDWFIARWIGPKGHWTPVSEVPSNVSGDGFHVVLNFRSQPMEHQQLQGCNSLYESAEFLSLNNHVIYCDPTFSVPLGARGKRR